ncbi:hypothetical protein CERZMDRAFT_101186 [Cercospora zeae-maydis SCOH1-5]|uniref:C2H2-type domain-containing protein n=1 Tax=Cercospora zeae-maydis SCOH1-5 TaxID=717836 RepID=A0A6A6F5Q7_9PEZI|nr:hypothetical protein CERZMDRAFT_101186 [Cercospora zeae-maydis SCOH1-5]
MATKPSAHVCLVCGRAYKTAETLNRHRKNHSATTNYVCDICDASFKWKDLLDRHYNIHSGGKQPLNNSRSQRACDRRSRLKTRCDGMVPCARCTRGGYTCTQKLKGRRARIERLPRASLDSGTSARRHDSPPASIETPEKVASLEAETQFDPQCDWMGSLWLEKPSWQWPLTEVTLATAGRGSIVMSMSPPQAYTMDSWQGNVDLDLTGSYLLPPAPLSDSEGYSPSYMAASVSPLPTTMATTEYDMATASEPTGQSCGQTTRIFLPF